jgi:hypothetical protein
VPLTTSNAAAQLTLRGWAGLRPWPWVSSQKALSVAYSGPYGLDRHPHQVGPLAGAEQRLKALVVGRQAVALDQLKDHGRACCQVTDGTGGRLLGRPGEGLEQGCWGRGGVSHVEGSSLRR